MIKKHILKIIPCLLAFSPVLSIHPSLPKSSSATTKKKLTVAEIKKKKREARANRMNNASNKLTHPYPHILIKDMTEDQLRTMIPYVKSLGDKESVFKLFHFLFSKSPSQNNIKDYKIDLADYCFSIKDYEKAAFSYEEFFILYPGSAEAEYSRYKAILCWFYQSLRPDRDQSNTDKTITLIDDYLRTGANKKFIDEVKSIRIECRQKLFEHEMHIFEHYLKRKRHTSAQCRYEYIEKNFKDIKDIDLYLIYAKKIQEVVKDPKTCPFLIKFNLNEALQGKKTMMTPEKKAKASLYFLS